MVVGGCTIAFLTVFYPKVSPITAPIYAALEGLVLGGISATFEARYPGIVTQAVGLSIGTLAMMLTLYGTGLIRATEKFKIGLVAATGAICLVYLVDIVAGFFGTRLPFIHETGTVGIGFSLVVVVIAALNLILDFDFIQKGPTAGTQVHGMVRRLQPAGHTGLDVLGNLAGARQTAGQQPGLRHDDRPGIEGVNAVKMDNVLAKING